ncbi:hypothetical protein VTN02DRAFT_3177 [Thermoascus thermophilus]
MGYHYIGGEPYSSRQWSIVLVTSFLLAFSTLAVALRLYARRLTAAVLYLDDKIIIVALFLSYGNCICEYVGLYYGLGKHASEVGEEKAARYLIEGPLSILLFYQRLFPVAPMKLACRYLQIFLIVWHVTFQTTAIFQCTPIRYFWDRSLPGGRCINIIAFYIALAATNCATDVILLFLPIPMVWNLRVRRSKKVALSGVFMLGAFVCAIALYRISTLPLIDPEDITWSNTYAGLWTGIESSAGVIVACLPSLMPIWVRFRGRMQDSDCDCDDSYYHSRQRDRYSGRTHLTADGYWRSRNDTDELEKLTRTGMGTGTRERPSRSRESGAGTAVSSAGDVSCRDDIELVDQRPPVGRTAHSFPEIHPATELQERRSSK